MNENTFSRTHAALESWESGKPDNYFKADANIQYVLRRILGDEKYSEIEDNLTAFGAACATIIDPAAKSEDAVRIYPRLDRYTNTGTRVEEIEFHPNHDSNGKLIWESGILAMQAQPGNIVHQQALLYLLTHNGEAGHACSIACTAGLIRALQTVGEDAVKERFLPSLLDANFDTMQHGAQFLTEVQGGSDVGANASVATRHEDGTWRITGEKWFCSNINADQFLLTARPSDATTGTRGLGLFIIPRQLDDGSTNGFYLRRLKDKLGTRTLPSAEVDFIDAVAYQLGAIDEGFKNTVELVLNTSRLMNASSCAGITRRAYLEAASFACTRTAFGSTIASYPLVQEAVADILSESYASTSSTFALAALLDKIETGQASQDEKDVYRLLVNLNKYITAIHGTESVHRAAEVFGGNGTIETFSILPRLYRDMLVLESWEGTHNVLCLQVLRDIAKYKLHEAFTRFIQAQLTHALHPKLSAEIESVANELERALHMLARLSNMDSTTQQTHIRRLADLMTHIAQAALLLAEAQWELEQGLPTIKPTVITYFVNKRLRPAYDPLEDDDYSARLHDLMMAY